MSGLPILRQRVRKREPYLADPTGRDVVFQMLDHRAEKECIREALVERLPRTLPQAGSVSIHSENSAVRPAPGQRKRVLPAAASQLEDDGLLEPEGPLEPVRLIASPVDDVVHLFEFGKTEPFLPSHEVNRSLPAVYDSSAAHHCCGVCDAPRVAN